MSHPTDRLTDAYEACAVMARQHYENFPVASLLLPAPMRPHIAAIYAFARIADDIADEGDEPAEARQQKLAAWQQQLHDELAHHEPAGPSSWSEDVRRGRAAGDPIPGGPEHPPLQLIIAAAAETIRSCHLPVDLFDDLISAFAQDTTTTRYETWDDVLSYCRRSANPVGRLVLLVAGDRRDEVAHSSDALCTALQLTNFWQDFGRDWRHGRLYVPRDVLHATGASESDLERGHWTAEWTSAVESCVATTKELFMRGRRVCDAVGGRLRVELRATWLGGRLILDRVAAHPDRVMNERPTIGRTDVPRLLWQLVSWRAEMS